MPQSFATTKAGIAMLRTWHRAREIYGQATFPGKVALVIGAAYGVGLVLSIVYALVVRLMSLYVTYSYWLVYGSLALFLAFMLYRNREAEKERQRQALRAEIARMEEAIEALRERIAAAEWAGRPASVDQYLLADVSRKLADAQERLQQDKGLTAEGTDWVKVALVVAVIILGVILYRVVQYVGPLPDDTAGTSPGISSPWERSAPSGRTCPTSYPIKGNASSGIYHLPGDDYYDRTMPEDCFASESAAQAAGYRRARR